MPLHQDNNEGDDRPTRGQVRRWVDGEWITDDALGGRSMEQVMADAETSGPSPADEPGQQKNAGRGQPQAVTAQTSMPPVEVGLDELRHRLVQRRNRTVGEQAIRDLLECEEALRVTEQRVTELEAKLARNLEAFVQESERVAELEAALRWIADARRAEEADPALWVGRIVTLVHQSSNEARITHPYGKGGSISHGPDDRKHCLVCAKERIAKLEEALFECAKMAGADISDGPPTWPDISVWAQEEVRRLRVDYDEALDELPIARKENAP